MALDFMKIKNLFVESDSATETTQTSATTSPSVPPSPVTSTPSTTVSGGSIDQKIFDSLMKAIEDHNMPGEDYLEFVSALKAMENIPLDEKMKVQTVLATLSTKGLSVQKIKDSANYYKTVLIDEQKQFYSELNSQVDMQLKSKEQGMADLQRQNTEKSEQIARLTQEINDNQKKIADIQSQIRESETKIKKAEDNFNTTFNHVVAMIDNNINKIGG